MSAVRFLSCGVGLLCVIAWAPAASADSLPARLPYSPGDPPLREYHLEREPRWSLIWAGSIVFGVAYVWSVAVAADSKLRDGSAMLLIPIAGPMVAAANVAHAKYQCGFTPPSAPEDCNTPSFFFALVGDAIMQVTGVGLLGGGVLARRKVWVRNPGFSLVPTLRFASGPRLGIHVTF
jgi:hypothetical protein